MSLFHFHEMRRTGEKVRATFGKDNLKPGLVAVASSGEKALCAKCGVAAIIHDPRLGFPCWYTVLLEESA